MKTALGNLIQCGQGCSLVFADPDSIKGPWSRKRGAIISDFHVWTATLHKHDPSWFRFRHGEIDSKQSRQRARRTPSLVGEQPVQLLG